MNINHIKLGKEDIDTMKKRMLALMAAIMLSVFTIGTAQAAITSGPSVSGSTTGSPAGSPTTTNGGSSGGSSSSSSSSSSNDQSSQQTGQPAVAAVLAQTAIDPVESAAAYAAKTRVSAGFAVAATSDAMVQSAAIAIQNMILSRLSALGNATLAAAAGNSAVRVRATLLTCVELSATTATKGADGFYHPTVYVNGINAGDTLFVLHYFNNAWQFETVEAVANGGVAFRTADFSPFAVVKVAVENAAAPGGSGIAPKTGETMPYATLIVVLALASAVVCAKKFIER